MLLSYISFFILGLAFVAVWTPVKFFAQPLWLLLLLLVLVTALCAQALSAIALVWIALAVTGFFLAEKLPRYRVWIMWPLAIYCLAMGMNLLPGFHSIALITPEHLGVSSIPFGMQYDLAKPIAGLLVFAFIAPRCKNITEIIAALHPSYLWMLPIATVLSLAMFMGLQVDIKYVWWTPIFVASNLLLSTIPEEAFFKSFIQHPLQERWGKKLWFLPLMGLLFAAVHSAPMHVNPWKFYGLLITAGTAYAWSFYRSGKIETAIAAHIGVNTLHFLLLTYPLAFAE